MRDTGSCTWEWLAFTSTALSYRQIRSYEENNAKATTMQNYNDYACLADVCVRNTYILPSYLYLLFLNVSNSGFNFQGRVSKHSNGASCKTVLRINQTWAGIAFPLSFGFHAVRTCHPSILLPKNSLLGKWIEDYFIRNMMQFTINRIKYSYHGR